MERKQENVQDASATSYWIVVSITAAALTLGVYARFKGLGTWPFGVDEFYISRSIDNILRSGLPEFSCGGYYPRGLLYQYLVAALRLTGLETELASRLVPALASLVALPAAFLVTRRFAGKSGGLLVVALLSISVWEVEMARFARMYAPFQAVFIWYVWYFLKYTADGERRALIPMIILSIVGVLTWEGGALLGLANLLPPFINHQRGSIRKRDWGYLAGTSTLFVAMYAYVTTNFRRMDDVPAFSEAFKEERAAVSEDKGTILSLLTEPFQQDPWFLAVVAPVLLLSVLAFRWIVATQTKWLTIAGLSLVLAASLLHQFVTAAAVLLALFLLRLIDWRELIRGRGRWFSASILACMGLWTLYGIFGAAWYPVDTGPVPGTRRLLIFAERMAGFPNILDAVVKPWLKAIPVLSTVLFLAAAGLAIQTISRSSKHKDFSLRALLILTAAMLMAVGASDPPREETRYAFFLYPILLTFFVVALTRLVSHRTSSPQSSSLATIGIALALFAATEDFQPRHLMTVDSSETNFRVGMPEPRASHYYPRADFRTLSDWLRDNVTPDDVVLSGISALGQYYKELDYIYLPEGDSLYPQYACSRGTIARWNNLPLIYGMEALTSVATPGARVFIVQYQSRQDAFISLARQKNWPIQVVPRLGARLPNVVIMNF